MALTKEKLKELFAAGEFDQYLPDPVVTWASITGKPSAVRGYAVRMEKNRLRRIICGKLKNCRRQ